MTGMGEDGEGGISGSFSEHELYLVRPRTFVIVGGINVRRATVAGVLGTKEPQAKWFRNEALVQVVGSAFGDSGLKDPIEAALSESRDRTLGRTRRGEVVVDDGLD